MRFATYVLAVISTGALLGGCRRVAPMSMTSSVPVSVTVSPVSGLTQRLTAVFEDPRGGSDVGKVTVQVMSVPRRPGDGRKWSAYECLMEYDVRAQEIGLVPNMGGVWGTHTAKTGSSDTVQNSQCTVIAEGASSEVSGKMLTVHLEVEFAPEFAGEKRVYLSSEDLDGVWSANYQQAFGSLTVGVSKTP